MNADELVDGETYLYEGRLVVFVGLTMSRNAAVVWVSPSGVATSAGPLVDPYLLTPVPTRFDRLEAVG